MMMKFWPFSRIWIERRNLLGGISKLAPRRFCDFEPCRISVTKLNARIQINWPLVLFLVYSITSTHCRIQRIWILPRHVAQQKVSVRRSLPPADGNIYKRLSSHCKRFHCPSLQTRHIQPFWYYSASCSPINRTRRIPGDPPKPCFYSHGRLSPSSSSFSAQLHSSFPLPPPIPMSTLRCLPQPSQRRKPPLSTPTRWCPQWPPSNKRGWRSYTKASRSTAVVSSYAFFSKQVVSSGATTTSARRTLLISSSPSRRLTQPTILREPPGSAVPLMRGVYVDLFRIW